VVKALLVLRHLLPNDTMTDAIEELKSKSSVPNNTIFDVSWQRRGHSSMSGCTTAIAMENGKIVDVELKSRYCKWYISIEEIRINNPNHPVGKIAK